MNSRSDLLEMGEKEYRVKGLGNGNGMETGGLKGYVLGLSRKAWKSKYKLVIGGDMGPTTGIQSSIPC